MRGHRLEVADVFHAHENEFLQRWGHTLSDQQRKVLRDIGLCRTAALGTHLERCDRCSYETVAYDPCRNRHCPKCQSSARDRWLMKQARSLLPVPYAHVVFTVPEQLAPLALRNQRLFYSLLFRAASETLLEIAADTIHLVVDNLSTHTRKALVDRFGEAAGGWLWERFTVHYTPKHGSWLNQAEIEIGLFSRQCLGKRRIGDIATLGNQANAWNRRANRDKITIKWKFTRKLARLKLNYSIKRS